MKKAVFQTETLTCPTCAQQIERALTRQAGVKEAKVLFHSSKVKITFDDTQVTADELEEVIARLGYAIISKKVS